MNEEYSTDGLEDIRDSTHTPNREVRHMCFTFDIVSGENVYQQHICYKCASDRHDFLDVLLTWKVSTQVRCVELICCDGEENILPEDEVRKRVKTSRYVEQ